MVALSVVTCFCLVVAPALAISAPGVALNFRSPQMRDIAIEDHQELGTRAVCSNQELSTRLLSTLCEYGQPLVDAISGCGGETWSAVASAYVLLCRTAPGGTPCGNFLIAGLTSPLPTSPLGSGYQFIQTVTSSCFPFVGTCQPACRDAITALRNNLVCCVDIYTALFSGSVSGIASAINYTFWSFCSVESQPSNCDSSLSFTETAAERQPPCSVPEIVEIVAETFYCARGGQAFLDSIANCDLADAALGLGFRPQDTFCAVNERGNSCYDRDIVSLLFTALNPATRSACNVAGNNVGQCTPECRSILQRFANSSVGCCVNNLFNRTDTLLGIQYIANYELWSACGFDTPGFCQSYQFNSGQMLKAATAMAFLLVLLLVL